MGQELKKVRLIYPYAIFPLQKNLLFQENCSPGKRADGMWGVLVIKFFDALIGPLL